MCEKGLRPRGTAAFAWPSRRRYIAGHGRPGQPECCLVRTSAPCALSTNEL